MKNEHENLIDEFIGDLDFEKMLEWLDLMDIDNELPPLADLYPDWEGEKKTELMSGLCDLFDEPIANMHIALKTWGDFAKSLPDNHELPVGSWHLFQKAKDSLSKYKEIDNGT